MAAGGCGFRCVDYRISGTAPAPSRHQAVAPALGDERAEINAVLARLVARPKLVAIAPGAIEAGAEQAMAAIGELAKRVEWNLGAMGLRWAAERVLYRAAIAEATYAAKAKPEAAKKVVVAFPSLTGDNVQIGISYYSLSPVKKVVPEGRP